MPKATADTVTTDRFELKTLPPDGFVVLRRMSYGQIVQRRAMSKMTVEAGKGKSFTGELAMASKEINDFEFKSCVVDHNCEDENGNKLNLNTPQDINRLDPKVGQEIEKLISDMNSFEDEDEEN
jgi:hypothetical protein